MEERVREGDWEQQEAKRKGGSRVSANRKKNKEGNLTWRREEVHRERTQENGRWRGKARTGRREGANGRR